MAARYSGKRLGVKRPEGYLSRRCGPAGSSAAVLVFAIDRRFRQAAGWAAASLLSFFGVIHAWEPAGLDVRFRLGLAAAPEFATMYALAAVLLWGLHRRERRGGGPPADGKGGRR